MICDTCGSQYTELTCPVCARRQYEKQFAIYQRDYLKRVANGKAQLVGTNKKGEAQVHAKTFGSPLTYCGQDTSRGWEAGKLFYDKLDSPMVCAACRVNIRSILREAA